MPQFSKLHRVPFTPRQMFDLVADVKAYPEFLPLCEGLRVLKETDEGATTVLVASMDVGYKSIHETFTTRVTLWPEELRVLVEYLDGPFKRLENRWRFLPADTGTDVEFFIDYEFRSAMLGMLMGSLFDKAFRRFTAAFEERARVVYGETIASGQA